MERSSFVVVLGVNFGSSRNEFSGGLGEIEFSGNVKGGLGTTICFFKIRTAFHAEKLAPCLDLVFAKHNMQRERELVVFWCWIFLQRSILLSDLHQIFIKSSFHLRVLWPQKTRIIKPPAQET